MSAFLTFLASLLPVLHDAFNVFVSKGKDPNEITKLIKDAMTVASDEQMKIEFPNG